MFSLLSTIYYVRLYFYFVRLWPRAGAVAARLWGLGENFESVSYYNTAVNNGGRAGTFNFCGTYIVYYQQLIIVEVQ